MYKTIIKSVLVFSSMFFTLGVFAQPTVTIVNKFGQDLKFQITSSNGNKYAPEFSKEFVLSNNQSVSSVVNKAPADCASFPFNPSTYISVKPANAPSFPTYKPKPKAFFALGRQCANSELAEVSGYLSEVIAFSWKNGDHVVLIFCKAKDYPCQ